MRALQKKLAPYRGRGPVGDWPDHRACGVCGPLFGTRILPGDAAQIRLGQQATGANVAATRLRLGLYAGLHALP